MHRTIFAASRVRSSPGPAAAELPGAWARAVRGAFAAIDSDPAQLLVVVVAADGDEVHATAQLTFIPGLARRGSLRARVEAVRVDERLRETGLGSALMRWSIDRARERGCSLVQLPSDQRRPAAVETAGGGWAAFIARRGSAAREEAVAVQQSCLRRPGAGV